MKVATFVVAAGLLLVAVACSDSEPSAEDTTTPTISREPTAAPTVEPTPAPAADSRVEAKVIRVVDGDTIEVEIDGRSYPLRYIGIDTPETRDPNSPVECFGSEATAANQQLVGGKTVLLEKDVSETDRYDRLLRYVYVGDELINERLVSDGYAVSSTYPPDVKHQERFVAAERAARDGNRGLWATCGGADTPLIAPESEPSAGDCDPSYPDVCIPSPPPDLDCGDITFRRFTVLAPDPHGFDGNDNDGIGCESG